MPRIGRVELSLDARPGEAALFSGLPGGFAAGFTLRGDGLDQLPAGTLGRRLARHLGAPDAVVCRTRQVHGATVLSVDGQAPDASGALLAGEGDAIVTGGAGRLLVVSTADCVPLLLLDEASGWIAAVHAGWRGAAAGIAGAALDSLSARGVDPSSLVALFGPSISRDAYEVGPEVVEALRRRHGGALPGGAVVPGRGDRSFVDVALLVEASLLSRGVRAERILRPSLCTLSDPRRFPSYRRDGARAGRILTGVVRLA